MPPLKSSPNIEPRSRLTLLSTKSARLHAKFITARRNAIPVRPSASESLIYAQRGALLATIAAGRPLALANALLSASRAQEESRGTNGRELALFAGAAAAAAFSSEIIHARAFLPCGHGRVDLAGCGPARSALPRPATVCSDLSATRCRQKRLAGIRARNHQPV